MGNVYEALQRGRREAAPTVAPVPRVSTPSPTLFGLEMRTLADRLQPLFDDRKPVILGITACSNGEGASTVARELAQYVAAEGREVLFCGNPMDIDIGRTDEGLAVTAQARELRHTGRRGLTLVDITDLYRVDSGTGAKIAFREWLKTQGGVYDAVIIDVPPVLKQQSWGSLLNLPDGIIMVVEAERTRSAIMKATAQVIQEANGHILGLVFNKRRQYIPKSLYRWL